MLFCFFCIRSHAPAIQHDVLTRTAKALARNGFVTAELTVSGRDVLLTGPAGAPIIGNRAREVASAVYGVRAVNVKVLTSGASTVTSVPPPESLADAKMRTTTYAPQEKLNALLRTSTIEFNQSSAQLTPAGRNTLDRIVPILTAAPKFLCDINGYTDSTGDPKMNVQLSLRRATATRDYLVCKGIASTRLSTGGFGDASPIASNKTPDGRRKNRRIEFLLKDKQ